MDNVDVLWRECSAQGCSNRFEIDGTARWFCSVECKSATTRRGTARSCEAGCGAVITGHPNKRYCSRKCQKRAHRERRAARGMTPNYDTRSYRLNRHYGITKDEYQSLLVDQGGGCAICGSPDPKDRWGRFHVDHDHSSGAVRGLLCGPCNTGIGHLGDNVLVLWAALSYLMKHTRRQVTSDWANLRGKAS